MSDEHSEIDVLALMQKELPPYVVKCFLLSGYDEKEVIKSMDTSDKEGNSISTIERYIDQRHKNDPSLFPEGTTEGSQFAFAFPPGHRIRICNFVRKVKDLCNPPFKRACTPTTDLAMKAKKCKTETALSTTNARPSVEVESVMEISDQVHDSICKWTQHPKNTEYCQLEDKKDYTVLVNQNEEGLSVKIACTSCRTAIRLQRINKHYQISNWCKHIRKCLASKKNPTNQPKLDERFFKGSTEKEMSVKKTSNNANLAKSTASHEIKPQLTDCSEQAPIQASNPQNHNQNQVFWKAPPLM